jgi:hypothetical protein
MKCPVKRVLCWFVNRSQKKNGVLWRRWAAHEVKRRHKIMQGIVSVQPMTRRLADVFMVRFGCYEPSERFSSSFTVASEEHAIRVFRMTLSWALEHMIINPCQGDLGEGRLDEVMDLIEKELRSGDVGLLTSEGTQFRIVLRLSNGKIEGWVEQVKVVTGILADMMINPPHNRRYSPEAVDNLLGWRPGTCQKKLDEEGSPFNFPDKVCGSIWRLVFSDGTHTTEVRAKIEGYIRRSNIIRYMRSMVGVFL